jgi:actin-like ATPase involved in cell morphogenesis
MYALGIDLGTTYTAAATWRDGHAEIASLGSRGAAIPSVVLLREDETFMTGEAADRRGLAEPQRVAREFKRRLGDTTPILLGGVPYSAEALMSRLLRSVVDEVATREGGTPSAICICHPANWGHYKTDLLRQAVRIAGLDQPVSYVTEPEAAAVFYARQQRIDPGAIVAVYDLGGGTFDAAVLRKTAIGFEILGQPEGIERLGGIDFDAAVVNHVNRALGGKLAELDEDDPAAVAAVARLKEECIRAKEALSSDTDTTIPVLLPNLSTEIRLTRAELESMVRPALYDTIEALRRALRSAGVTPEQLAAVLLVGGSSRMPVVAQMVGAELGRPVAVDAHPKHAVALGASRLAGGESASPAAGAAAPAPGPASAMAGPASAMGGAASAMGGPAAPGAGAGRAVVGPPAGSPVSPPVGVAGAGLAAAAAGHPAAHSTAHPTSAHPTSASRQANAAHLADSASAQARRGTQYGVPRETPSADEFRAADRAQPTTYVAKVAGAPPAPAPAPPAPPPRRRLPALLAAGVGLAVVLGGGIAYAVSRDGGDPGAGPANSPTAGTTTTAAGTPSAAAPAVPADEQCTPEIKSNTRWVCLTKATLANNKITINYESGNNGRAFDVSGGFHLHIYGTDETGNNPPDTVEGTQAAHPGLWYVEDKNPSVRSVTSQNFKEAIGADAKKVCARIADSRHRLVQDGSGAGTFKTGNCVPITNG